MTATGQELVGQTIAGKYEILRLIGEGGMGTVYQARQVAMDRMVALKLIRPELVLTPEVAGRFQTEMRVTARVEHPNTVRLYDFGEASGRLFLAMEFLSGTPLTQAIAAGPMPVQRIVHIGKQVANALGAIHAMGVVHRDLKPDNVILLESFGQPDFVKVLDFGVAKPLDDSNPKLTAAGHIVGTPAYMAPEQAMAHASDARADLYSLGIILYEMACGRLPFPADSTTRMLIAHAMETPRPLREVAPGVSPELAALVDQLLEKDPAARPQTVPEVVSRLEACGGAGAVAVAAAKPKPKRRWLVMALVLAGLGAAGVAALVVVGRGMTTTTPTPTPTPVAVTDAAGAVVVGDATVAVAAAVAAAPDAAASVAAAADAAAAVAAPPDAAPVVAPPPDAAPRMLPPDATPSAAPVPRRQLDALLEKAGEPLAPASCRVTDAATLKRLEDAARALHPRGDTFGALAALGETTGDAAEEWTLRARAQLLGDPAKALTSAEEAVRLCPRYAVPHNVAGNALQKLGRLEQAEEAYTRALWEEPAYDPPRFNLGLLQLRRKDPSAVWTFSEIVKRRPDYPNIYLVRAQAHLLKGNQQEALADLEEAVRRAPKSAEARAALEQLREHMGKKRERQ